ncbi:MAG: hypothetical protein RL213_1126 [Bacteroidota bacterium]|jgi:hypothetical protein
MPPILRNILSILAGVILGSVVNMGIVLVSGYLIALPPGADVSTPEGLKATIHLFEPKHFLFPFLAHAIGTFVGGFTATRLSAAGTLRPALVVSAVFLVGGIQMVMAVPAPMWFNVTDLVVAYIPMTFLGYKLAVRKS